MRRATATCLSVVAALGVTGCGVTTTGDDDAGRGSPSPTASPSVSAPPVPSALPTPSAPPAGDRFDGVDLGAALVASPFQGGDGWGAWATETYDQLLPGLDPAAFEAAPACSDAVRAAVSPIPSEVVAGGYPYDGTLATWIVVARMASPQEAADVVSALEQSVEPCDGIDGVPQQTGGVVGVGSLYSPSSAVQDAGMTSLALSSEGSFHPTSLVVTSHEELVVVVPSDAGVLGWDDEVVTRIQTQIDAFDAAVD